MATEQQEPCRKAVRRALTSALAVASLMFALATCGEEEQRQASEARPLPVFDQELRPGYYRSQEFKPSVSFKVDKGWRTEPPELSDNLLIARGDVGGLGFANAHEVYEPAKTSVPSVVGAPDDIVGWFRQHPLLRTSEPKAVTVGGVEGERFDVVVGELPEDYLGICGRDCVATIRFSDGTRLSHPKGGKWRLIVLEDVDGETVEVIFGSRASDFDEFAPEAQEVINTVEWGRA